MHCKICLSQILHFFSINQTSKIKQSPHQLLTKKKIEAEKNLVNGNLIKIYS
jgi:hypothetical protein